MPAAMACCSDRGSTAISRSRSPMPAVATNSRPAMATAPRAAGHGTFIPSTSVYAKKKLCPIAGATAIG